MGRLTGKIAVVTGGTTGIGLATARLFAAEGASVVVTGRNQETLAVARKELAGAAEVIASDAADKEQIGALVERIRKSYGRIDVLFLNAGIARFAPIAQTPDSVIEEQLHVNYFGAFVALREALPLLGRGSSVIVNTTIAAEKGLPSTAAYAASKAALAALARVAARELAERGIRVNAVSPGPIATPIYGKLGLGEAALQGLQQQMASSVPLQRFGSAEEVARTALFLASDDSSYVSGQELGVDGGLRVA
jgi:NAD(P)-dependent dehydrogenase (short-subunit alcohol dehydrogenase family)